MSHVRDGGVDTKPKHTGTKRDEFSAFFDSINENTDITREIADAFKDSDVSLVHDFLIPFYAKSEDELFEDIVKEANPIEPARSSSFLSTSMYQAIKVISNGENTSHYFKTNRETVERVTQRVQEFSRKEIAKISIYHKKAELCKLIYAERLKDIDDKIRDLTDKRQKMKVKSDEVATECCKLGVVKSSLQRQPQQSRALMRLFDADNRSDLLSKGLDDSVWGPIARTVLSEFDVRPHVLDVTMKQCFINHVETDIDREECSSVGGSLISKMNKFELNSVESRKGGVPRVIKNERWETDLETLDPDESSHMSLTLISIPEEPTMADEQNASCCI